MPERSNGHGSSDLFFGRKAQPKERPRIPCGLELTCLWALGDHSLRRFKPCLPHSYFSGDKMKNATLCIVTHENKILLGMKKRGFGEGKWNGFGGKVQEEENVEDAAKRELLEEAAITAQKLDKIGEITFLFPHKEEWNQIVHLFYVPNFEGTPKETEEMKPQWFDIDKIPFEKMWDDDKYWLPKVLSGKKIHATFIFDKDNETIVEMKINEN